MTVAMKIIIALAFMPFVWCSQKFVPGKNSQCLLYLYLLYSYFTDLNKSSYKCAQKARNGKLTRLLLTPINGMQTLALALVTKITSKKTHTHTQKGKPQTKNQKPQPSNSAANQRSGPLHTGRTLGRLTLGRVHRQKGHRQDN